MIKLIQEPYFILTLSLHYELKFDRIGDLNQIHLVYFVWRIFLPVGYLSYISFKFIGLSYVGPSIKSKSLMDKGLFVKFSCVSLSDVVDRILDAVIFGDFELRYRNCIRKSLYDC